MTTAPRLILASASPRREELMREAGFAFEVIPSPAEEIHDAAIPLTELTEQNARRKAEAVASDYPEALVIGADTLVSIDGDPIGKPRDFADATRIIGRLNGRTHEVCTGVCLCRLDPAMTVSFHVITEVTFKTLTPDAIESYLGMIDPLDKAGAYAAQEHGSLIIHETEGSWTNVVGLPMDELAAELRPFGAERRVAPAD